jgi:CRP/FNR family cyclic AMP-dependent transcriptional regulator
LPTPRQSRAAKAKPSWQGRQKPNLTRRRFSPGPTAALTVSNYRKGQAVFAQGEPADSIFYIQEGKVKVTVVSEQGKEAVVAFLEAEDFIGEGCLTGRPRRVSTARAMTDCVITRMEKATMVRMLGDQPKFSQLFTTHLLARTIRVDEDLVDQLSIPARSVWRGLCYCWQISARTEGKSR